MPVSPGCSFGFELVTPVDDMVLTGEIVSLGSAVGFELITLVEGVVLIIGAGVISTGAVAGIGIVIIVS